MAPAFKRATREFVRRILSSPRAGSVASWGLGLVSAWGCFAYFGLSLAGAPGMSQLEMILRSVVPVALASLFLGILSGGAWLQMVKVGLVPPVLLGAVMVAGFAEQGEVINGPPLALVVGMITSVALLGFLGSRISHALR